MNQTIIYLNKLQGFVMKYYGFMTYDNLYFDNTPYSYFAMLLIYQDLLCRRKIDNMCVLFVHINFENLFIFTPYRFFSMFMCVRIKMVQNDKRVTRYVGVAS